MMSRSKMPVNYENSFNLKKGAGTERHPTASPLRVTGRKSHSEQIWTALLQIADIDFSREDSSVGPKHKVASLQPAARNGANVPLVLLHEGKDSLIVGHGIFPWNSMRACGDLDSLAIG